MSLAARERLPAERHREFQARPGALEAAPADLADALEPVAERVRVHAQVLRRVLLLARLEVGAERGDQVPLAGAVVLDKRPEMPAAVVDQALVRDRGEEPGEAELGHGDDLAPALEASERLHHGRHLAPGARGTRPRFGPAAEADPN